MTPPARSSAPPSAAWRTPSCSAAGAPSSTTSRTAAARRAPRGVRPQPVRPRRRSRDSTPAMPPPRPAWSASSPADDLGEQPVPMFAHGERRRGPVPARARAGCSTSETRSPWSSPSPAPRRSTRPSWSTSTTSRCRPSSTRSAAAEPGAPELTTSSPRNIAIRRRRRGRPARRRRGRGPRPDREQPAGDRADRGQRDPRRPDADDAGHRLTVWLSTQHPHLGQQLFATAHRAGPAGDPGRRAPRRRRVRRQGRHLPRPRSGRSAPRSRSAGRSPGPRPAARRCSRCTAAARCSTPSSGLTRDGRITGLRARVDRRLRRLRRLRRQLRRGSTRTMAQGPYVIPRIRYDALLGGHQHRPVGAFRGAGRPEAAALLERILDLAADELGLAPEEIRRRNFVATGRLPVEDTSPGDLRLRRLRPGAHRGAAAGRRRRRPRRAGAPARDRAMPGSSASASRRTSRSRGSAAARWATSRSTTTARRRSASGTSAHGQGHATAFSMIAAERLGLPMDRITYEQADTAVVPARRRHGWRPVAADGRPGGRAGGGELLEKARGWRPSCSRRRSDDVELADDGFAVRGVPTRSSAGATWPARPPSAGEPLVGQRRLRAGARDVPVRHPRRDRRGRHRDRAGHAGAARRRRRLRPGGQPAAGRRPAARRRGAGHQPGAVGGVRLRRRGHPADLDVRRLRDAHRRPTPRSIEAHSTETPTPYNEPRA